ncbi:MAG: hypothetical protein AB1529_05520 [Candidatus Micrarchaeota archaeon]
MESKDVMLAAASLAAVLFLILVGVIALVFLFTLGSPLMMLAGLLAMGALGLIALFGLLAALVSVWYVIYALLKSAMEQKAPEKQKGGYTLGRIKKA